MGSCSISVRGLAAIAVVCALACLGAASASAAQLAVVGNRESNSVSVVNTATNQVVGEPIAAGEGPASVAITPDGRYAYVADVFGESVSVIDTSTRQPVGEPIEVGGLPFGLAITPDGSRVFVTDLGPKVFVIDTETNHVVGEVEVGTESTGVAISPNGKFAYVAEGGAETVEVIDTETMEVVGEPIEVGERPAGIEFTPDGATAYVVDRGILGIPEVSAIDTATRKVTPILLSGKKPRGIAIAPDGRKAFVVNVESKSVSVIDTATNQETDEIEVGAEPQEVAIAADGKTLYVTESEVPLETTHQVERIDVETGKVVGSPIAIPGEFPAGIALTPDQSPTAVFAAPNITAGVPATFSGASSTDTDGTIASYSWAFGDGKTGSGISPTHTYAAPGSYNAKLSVVDDQGCGGEEVFTGRTAYCSGGASSVTHLVTAKLPSPPPPPPGEPSNRFRFGRLVHNRRNGTVRLQVKLPAAGSVLLLGGKVHLVRKKIGGPGSMWLTIHPRVEVNKRLKKVQHIAVRVRVTFSPTGGRPRTKAHSFTLLRAPRRHHRR
jgi:YVTN family beta-propeller protein